MSGRPAPPPARRMAGVRGSAVREILELVEQQEVLSMAGGLPAPELFDADGIAAAFEAVLRGPGARSALQYSVTAGDAQLRDLLAGICRGRGIPATPEQVLVTTGSQQALDLVATTLLDPGDAVIVERPCYLAALQLFALAGLRVVSAPTDGRGLDPEGVRAAIRRHRAKVVYTVPNFQNPTGATLAGERRAALAAVAAQEGAWIVEDDPYGELRYRGDAPAPVAAHEPERVVYVSTLSKILAPGLRLGWVVAPAPLRAAMATVKQARDLHTSTLDQRAAAAYIAGGRLPGHLDHLRREYRRRLDALLNGLPAHTPPGTTWTEPEGGMFVWLVLPGGTDAARLLEAAVREGVAFVPGAPFYADDPLEHTARLSFVTLEPRQIAQGLAALGRATRIAAARA